MNKNALFLVGGLLCAQSAVVLAQVATTTCTAGHVDTSFGAAGTGYVQISPTLSPGTSSITVEGQALDATGESFTLSEAAIDAGGNGIPDLAKVKRNGVRDLTFGGFGSIVPQQPLVGAPDATLAIDGVGNLLVAMDTADGASVVISRYSPAGVIDPTYGVSGIATIPINGVTGPWAIGVATDGSVFIATRGFPPLPAPQFPSPVVAKVTPSGALDTSFGQGGYSFFYNGAFGPRGKATDLILQANGTILVAGRVGDNVTFNRFFVARLLANGVLDTTFGTSAGMTIIDFGTVLAFGRKLAVQSDGRIVVVGGIGLTPTGNALDSGVARLNSNGSLDTSFNSTGMLRIVGGGGAFGVALQNNNKILITATPSVNAAKTLIGAAVTRLTTAGQLDTVFGSTGTVILPVPGYALSSATNITYGPGGKILVHVTADDATFTNLVENVVRLDSGSGFGCH